MTKAPEQIHLWCELAGVNGLTPSTELVHCTTGTVFLKHLINSELFKITFLFLQDLFILGRRREQELGREVSRCLGQQILQPQLWVMAEQGDTALFSQAGTAAGLLAWAFPSVCSQ